MKLTWEQVKAQFGQKQSYFDDKDSVLGMLYEAYSERNNTETDQIKADFKSLYEAMNGMALQCCDQIIYPVCTLCRSHERNGFINGIKLGMLLHQELNTDIPRQLEGIK